MVENSQILLQKYLEKEDQSKKRLNLILEILDADTPKSD